MRKKISLFLILTLLTSCLTACQSSNNQTYDNYQDEYLGEIVIEEVDLNEIEILNLDLNNYVKLPNYKSIITSTQQSVITKEQIQEKVNEYIKLYGVEYEQITDRNVSEGDYVNLQYVTLIEGETVENVSNMYLKVGSNYMIPEFEKALIGKAVNETIRLNIIIPETNEQYKGKEATYSIVVNYICGEEVKNEYNDEYIIKITNGKHKTIEEFESEIRKTLENEANINTNSMAWTEIVNASIVTNVDKFVDEELENLIKEYRKSIPNPKMSDNTLAVRAGFKTYEEFKENMRMEAIQITKEKFVTYTIAKKENLILSPEEYRTEAEKLADEYGYTFETLEKTIPRKELYYTILSIKVMNYLADYN